MMCLMLNQFSTQRYIISRINALALALKVVNWCEECLWDEHYMGHILCFEKWTS